MHNATITTAVYANSLYVARFMKAFCFNYKLDSSNCSYSDFQEYSDFQAPNEAIMSFVYSADFK